DHHVRSVLLPRRPVPHRPRHGAGPGCLRHRLPSAFHAVQETARRLREAGFTPLQETDHWSAQDVTGDRYVIRDGSIIAWSTPGGADATTAWRIVGSHTDSPALKLKPNPELRHEELSQVGVEIYGGPLLNSWLDR